VSKHPVIWLVLLSFTVDVVVIHNRRELDNHGLPIESKHMVAFIGRKKELSGWLLLQSSIECG
jgi:hypothetical protein